MASTNFQQTVDAVWRMEAAKIIATMTRMVGDVSLAEDLASEALVDALTQWPSAGVPRNAGAWLTAVAKRKAIDHWRRRPDRAHPARYRRPDHRGDRPGLPGFHSDCGPTHRPRQENAGRGYSASSGQRWVRDELGAEALRLGRVSAALVPEQAEVHGLLALMEFQSSRFAARTDADGTPVLLADQDRSKWDRAQINRGVAALARAQARAGARGLGPYALQAALAECHATAPSAADTDWARIVALYEALSSVAPSPVVDLNRAVAVAMDAGPVDALAIVDGLVAAGELTGSYLLPSVRGELLSRLDRHAEAAVEFDTVAALTANEREREVLSAKALRARAAEGSP